MCRLFWCHNGSVQYVQHESWLDMLDQTRHLVDGRGMLVDEDILETVAILRTIGVNTVSSCGGHLDRGYGPYVWFEAKDAAADRARYAEYQRAAKSDTPTDAVREVGRKISRDEIAEKRKLFPYLEEFYATRNSRFANRLLIENHGFAGTMLHCQGAMLVGVMGLEPLEVRRRLLKAHQREMRDFTEFLKVKVLTK